MATGSTKVENEDGEIFIFKPGVARLKQMYICKKGKREPLANDSSDQPASKKPKKQKGQNKHRPRDRRLPDKKQLCSSVRIGKVCSYGEECRYLHDVEEFMKHKLPNIGPDCVFYTQYGHCPYGLTCRFGEKHISQDFKNIVHEPHPGGKWEDKIKNVLPKQLQDDLRKRKVVFSRAEIYLANLKKPPSGIVDQINSCGSNMVAADCCDSVKDASLRTCGPFTDEDAIKIKPTEKTAVKFKDKLYLAPLTTVGNLPFRRLCKEFGADITCGEMALCTNLLQGQQSEWALTKRHVSEDVFGVQICGGYPDTMSKCAEMLCDYTEVDFIDINCGCPIDLVYNSGAGSALMRRIGRFEEIVKGMDSVMNVPLTVKMRTGVYDKNWNAHTLVPKLREWGVSMVTIHGRSREQRYTKTADYDYIKMCADAAGSMPIFGNGDVLSYEDYNSFLTKSSVSGLMIGRGALIKPWIFTEIKEQRHWDISSHERFDILRKYSNYGLEHWGSDTQGVQRTRKFLLEWLSFLHRYIPVGLLEYVPNKINERAPSYFGRDDLETLMASSNCLDWVRISEMLLGPVEEGFKFLPKHKANSYN